MEKVKVKVKCSHCSYEWRTKSEMLVINCPSCRKPTNNTSVVANE